MGNTNMDLLLSFQAFFLINLVSEFFIFHHYILQVWSNDVLMKSMQTHNGSILSICMEGKWLFTGGWDKTVSVQELMVNEFHVDAMAYWFNILWFCRNSFVLLARKAFCWIC
ncbi:hypothetical protein Pint_08107 [Pistacia integerrima]|uniref:Uncharacterized protein n=1 Tax=Pistacia integerrima TaxID=434235 RepID=A0ACC0XTX6_9ROSI|nr:hypothetical protein Pint_08107 [Pistacia integerrima]